MNYPLHIYYIHNIYTQYIIFNISGTNTMFVHQFCCLSLLILMFFLNYRWYT